MVEPKIIFEDENLLVLDKPAGMTVNRAETTKGEVTVQDWIEKNFQFSILHCRINFQLNKESDFLKRAGIVHRLDKETSGLLLVAKTPEAFENLQHQFKERKVKKVYSALVHGRVEPEEGEIRVPVGRLPWDRKKFGVIAGGREAVTAYKVLSVFSCQLSDFGRSVSQLIRQTDKQKNYNQKTETRKQITEYSFLELYPQTGRTHQIRVHLKYFGHPIFSDPLYAGRKQARKDRKVLSRLFLHASKISFYHPRTNNLASFESPLPGELKEFLEFYQH